jgi:hypothetical protein
MEERLDMPVSGAMNEVGGYVISDEENSKVSVLTNSICYFLDSVFILNDDEHYRLVVLHNGRLLVDEHYKTAKGSKIAFARFYGNRLWKHGAKPRWSPFH